MNEELEALILSVVACILAPLQVCVSLVCVIHKLAFGVPVNPNEYEKNLKSILITGGSGGIGKELALQYSKPGRFLVITGTNVERLKKVKDECERLGAKVEVCNIDVSNDVDFVDYIIKSDEKYMFDMVIANAGVSSLTSKEIDMFKKCCKVNKINNNGVYNTVIPIFERMCKRKAGQLCIVSSVAGIYMPTNTSFSYGSSKASVLVLGNHLRAVGKAHNVKVNTVCPGFVVSSMTDAIKNTGREIPGGCMETDKACRIIRESLINDHGVIVFPFFSYLFVWVQSVLPFYLQGLVRSYTNQRSSDLNNCG